MTTIEQSRSGAVIARQAHNLEVAGLNPACATKPRGYAAVGLYMPKTETNVGGAMRAAYCYGAALVAVQDARFRRLVTDTQKAWRHIPVLEVENLRDVVPFDCQVICVELTDNAKRIFNFVHPQRAFYIFGPEDGCVPKELTDRYYTIQVPTMHCMNLAATVNVVLYDRLCKQERMQ